MKKSNMKNSIVKILVAVIIIIVANQVSAGTYNSSICYGSSISIGNTWPGGVYYIWNTTPPQYGVPITVAPLTNTQYICTVLNTSYVQLGADTFNITVNALPTGTVTASQTICAGTTVTLTATGGASYLWSPGGATTPSITVTPSVTAVYSVIITGTNGCSITLYSTVTVNPLPTFTNIGSNSPVCSGNTINLTATATTGSTYVWTGPNGFTSTLQNPSIPNASSVNAGTYSCIATLNGCSSTPATTNVVVNTTPVITVIGSNSPVCSGNTINLNVTATTGSTYYWTGPNGFTSTLQNPSIPNASSVNAGTYSCIATLNGCSSTPATTNVVVNTTPVITVIGSNSPVCSGNTINLNVTANSGCTYYWTGPNGFTSNLQNPSIPNCSVANAGNYNCVATLNGCSTSANTSVVVNITPTIGTTGSNSPVCEGSNLSLYTTASPAGCSYYWTGPNGFSSNIQNPVISNATVAATGTYNVTVTLTGCSASTNTSASVVAFPNANISGNLSVCLGSSTTLTASGGTSYLWSTGATTPSITVSPVVTTNYSVLVTATGGCSAQAFATVVVNPVPSISFSPVNPVTCEGQNITITASGGNTYLWSNGTSGASITVAPNNTAIYSVTATSSAGCSANANIIVTVNPKPIVVLYLPQQNICVDANPITLTGGQPVGGSYYGTGVFSGLFYPSTVGIGTYNINYTFTNTYGCTDIATSLLAVNPLPTVIFNSIFPNPVSINASVFQLNTGIPLGGIYSGSGVVGGWFYPTTAGVGVHTITYTYTDFMNCVNSAMQTITVTANLGIEDENSPSLIRIFPNPVTDFLNVEMEEIPDYVQIISLTGSVLQTDKVNSKEFKVDVSHLSKGVYFVRFTHKNGSMGTTKFVK